MVRRWCRRRRVRCWGWAALMTSCSAILEILQVFLSLFSPLSLSCFVLLPTERWISHLKCENIY